MAEPMQLPATSLRAAGRVFKKKLELSPARAVF
jgi:hypothetical protein